MLDFKKIKTIPFKERKHLEYLRDFKKIDSPVDDFNDPNLEELAKEIVLAHRNKKQVIFMVGGHVIKTGVAAYIVGLMKRGVITHIASNGAFAIHDFEIAFAGETSEDVKEYLKNGTFGMVEETGKYLNEAAKDAAVYKNGFGYAIGKKITDLNLKFKEYSVIYNAYKLSIPVTIHVAIGTDIIHQHPSCDGAALGQASYDDFKIFAESVSNLEGGVIVNVGSCVIMPEVFLKALTIARNLGYKANHFTAANLDMIDHYRPRVNVLERPTKDGGKAIFVKGRHETTIPNLHKKVVAGLNGK